MSTVTLPVAISDASASTRLQLPPELEKASGLKKLDWILSLDEPEEFVRDLAPQELYYWMRDIGKEDAYPLLEYAEPEQLRALLALDGWTKNEPSIPRFLEWLNLALTADLETAERFLEAQPDELYLWLFSGDIHVLPHDTDIDQIPDELAFFPTPDGFYVVTLPRDHALEGNIEQLMRLMWSVDMERAQLIFQQAQFEVNSLSEDELAIDRKAQLQDLGFETYDDAQEVFSVIPAGELKTALQTTLQDEEEPPLVTTVPSSPIGFALSLPEWKGPTLLQDAVAQLNEVERAHFQRSFSYLSNKVFMAETGDLAFLEHLPEYSRYAFGLCNLGLHYLADDSSELALRLLPRLSAEQLFQSGWTQIQPLARRARKVARRAGIDLGYALFGSPTDDALYGAYQVRPLFAERILSEDTFSLRAISTPDELARLQAYVAFAEEALDAFETRFGLTVTALENAHSLGLSSDARRRLRLTTFLRTGMANALLSDEFSFAPLDKEAIAAFARAALDKDGRLSPLFAELVTKLKASADSALVRLVERAVDELVESLGNVEERDLDLRYVGEIFLLRS